MKAYKLLKMKKDGNLGSLFIDKKEVREMGVWLSAKLYPTKGYAVRKGWHCCFKPYAPHLSVDGRVWAEVDVDQFTVYDRPESQGGEWILAERMKILRILSDEEVQELTVF